MSLQPALVVLAAFVVPFAWGAEPLLAQGPDQGPPSLPPGLHDRALPPGKPFDGGGFDPTGLQSQQNPAGDDASDAVTDALARVYGPQAVASELSLAAAVELFHRAVAEASQETLADPAGELLRLRVALHRELYHRGLVRGPALPSLGTPLGETESSAADLREAYRIVIEPAGAQQDWAPWVAPGFGASNPTGLGLRTGDVWVGTSYQPRARYSDGQTGAAAFGFGLGDPERWVSLQVAVNSFSTVSSGFFNRMAVDLHATRMLPGDVLLGLGWETALSRGPAERDSGQNRYAVVSRFFDLRPGQAAYLGQTMLSLGVGDGRFQSEVDFAARKGGVGVFGSAAVRLAAPVSAIAEWTGQDLLLGMSATPLRSHRLGITAALVDVTGAAGDGARFAVGATYTRNLLGR